MVAGGGGWGGCRQLWRGVADVNDKHCSLSCPQSINLVIITKCANINQNLGFKIVKVYTKMSEVNSFFISLQAFS